MNKQHAAPAKPAAAAKKMSGGQVGCLVVVLLLVIGGIASALGLSSGGGSGGSADDLRFGAYDVCQQFVKDELKAPATADFPDYVDNASEILITHTGGDYTVISHVDAENSFGAKLRNSFTCEVSHVSGAKWNKVDVSVVEG